MRLHCTPMTIDSKQPDAGPTTVSVTVENRGNRPIQVGSHFHFFEVDSALYFERWKAYGMRLDIAPGTAVRFEPRQQRTVELVKLDSDREVWGFSARGGPRK